ncbi:MAG: rhomboid family intramembrane serine protease [Acidobacteriaceae bacterium]|nr:rhomboid family intramembrane serine protease [Acidobacteriaceae bacterium]MBV9780553.1 rhomboid family intramembrane serine protease [Acidobacteriaceae bacterium]
MSFSSRSYVNPYIPSNRFPAGLKWLLIVNTGLFVLFILAGQLAERQLGLVVDYLGLVPAQVVHRFAIWQLVTYMFVHSGFSHILWNMLALWMFGAQIERLWGTPRFLRFYFTCGVFAALTVIVCAYIFGGTNIMTVGSSGAIYGILVAYGLMFPDQTVLFGFLIPIKSKYFVMIIGGIVFLQAYMGTVGGKGSGVAVVAHLGGLVAGYLLLRGNRLRSQIVRPISASYRDWKLRRARRQFEVYRRKHNSDRDRWVH